MPDRIMLVLMLSSVLDGVTGPHVICKYTSEGSTQYVE